MIKKGSILLFVFLLFSSVVCAMDFSADSIMTHKGKMTTKGKIYYKKDRYRMDIKAPEEMMMIMRMDKKVMWNIIPKQGMYMELPLDMRNKPMVQEKFEGEIERKHVGNETINEHPAKKYLITYKSGEEKHQVYQWFATDINFPVKTAAIDGAWVQEFKNIKMGSQPDRLFELPKGYKKFQFPAGGNFPR